MKQKSWSFKSEINIIVIKKLNVRIKKCGVGDCAQPPTTAFRTGEMKNSTIYERLLCHG